MRRPEFCRSIPPSADAQFPDVALFDPARSGAPPPLWALALKNKNAKTGPRLVVGPCLPGEAGPAGGSGPPGAWAGGFSTCRNGGGGPGPPFAKPPKRPKLLVFHRGPMANCHGSPTGRFFSAGGLPCGPTPPGPVPPWELIGTGPEAQTNRALDRPARLVRQWVGPPGKRGEALGRPRRLVAKAFPMGRFVITVWGANEPPWIPYRPALVHLGQNPPSFFPLAHKPNSTFAESGGVVGRVIFQEQNLFPEVRIGSGSSLIGGLRRWPGSRRSRLGSQGISSANFHARPCRPRWRGNLPPPAQAGSLGALGSKLRRRGRSLPGHGGCKARGAGRGPLLGRGDTVGSAPAAGDFLPLPGFCPHRTVFPRDSQGSLE